MKTKLLIIALLSIAVLASACSKKMNEQEHYTLAQQYMEQENYAEAEKHFLAIYKDFSDGVRSSKALFMVGYINANYLSNLDKAKKYYTTFLEAYPNHDLALAAQYELDNLGTSVDELPFLQQGEGQGDANTANKGGDTSSN